METQQMAKSEQTVCGLDFKAKFALCGSKQTKTMALEVTSKLPNSIESIQIRDSHLNFYLFFDC